jgi:poly(3-hydroxybutyrate) depolymerase
MASEELLLGAARDSYLYMPAGYRVERPVQLVLLLHGAGGHAHQGIDLLRGLADAAEAGNPIREFPRAGSCLRPRRGCCP